jgi:AI-2 transport protein TqsA
VAATFTAGALVLAAAVVGVLPVAISAIADVGSYADHLRDTARKVLENLPAAMITPQQSEELANRINTFEVKDVAVRLLPFIGVAGGGLLTFLGNAGLVLVFLLFFLLGRGDTGRPVSDMRRQIELRIQAYLSVTLLISLATGFLVGLTLWLLGVPLAWLFGLLAFALNFIPTVGSAVATLLPIPVILFGSDLSPVMMTLALGVPAIIQFVLGNLVAPKLLGDRLQLSPIAVMLGLLLLGAIWGIVGMILSTPLLAIFKITLDRLALDVPMLQPLSRLLTAGPQ